MLEILLDMFQYIIFVINLETVFNITSIQNFNKTRKQLTERNGSEPNGSLSPKNVVLLFTTIYQKLELGARLMKFTDVGSTCSYRRGFK